MTSQDNRQCAQAFIQAINDGSREVMSRLLHPDASWTVPDSAAPPYAGTHRGAQVIIEMMLGAVEHAFDARGVTHEVSLCIAEADHVVVETRMVACQPNGKNYDNRYVFIFELAEGRIVAIREHVDTAYAIRFFGA